EERGQFAVRGDIVDIYPATEERAVRIELFDIEIERLTWFSTFTQRSLEDAERVEIEPAAELAAEHRELAEMAAESEEEDRPDIADVLPLDRFRELLDLIPENTQNVVAWNRRGEAERALYNLARVDAQFLDGHVPEKPMVLFATAGLREGFVWPSAKVAILPEHRLLRRRRGPERAGPSRNAMTSFTE